MQTHRIIGIRHRVKKTVDGEARPTQVCVLHTDGTMETYDLDDEQAEFDWKSGKTPIEYRRVNPTDDLSPYAPRHLKTRAIKKGEDVESILRGIALPKGRVHIQFGAPLQGEYHAADEVAAAIDQAIVAGYRLFPSNLVAYEQLQKVREAVSSLQDAATQMLANVDTQELARKASEFSARISGYPKRVQNLILEMYANPLLSKFQLQQDQLEHPA